MVLDNPGFSAMGRLHEPSLMMTDLERSHAELRAALRLAGKRIREYNKVRDCELLALLRRVLRESRIIAATEQNAPAPSSRCG